CVQPVKDGPVPGGGERDGAGAVHGLDSAIGPEEQETAVGKSGRQAGSSLSSAGREAQGEQQGGYGAQRRFREGIAIGRDDEETAVLEAEAGPARAVDGRRAGRGRGQREAPQAAAGGIQAYQAVPRKREDPPVGAEGGRKNGS